MLLINFLAFLAELRIKLFVVWILFKTFMFISDKWTYGLLLLR